MSITRFFVQICEILKILKNYISKKGHNFLKNYQNELKFTVDVNNDVFLVLNFFISKSDYPIIFLFWRKIKKTLSSYDITSYLHFLKNSMVRFPKMTKLTRVKQGSGRMLTGIIFHLSDKETLCGKYANSKNLPPRNHRFSKSPYSLPINYFSPKYPQNDRFSSPLSKNINISQNPLLKLEL